MNQSIIQHYPTTHITHNTITQSIIHINTYPTHRTTTTSLPTAPITSDNSEQQ
ncbi:hypothetical protein SAMD00019534_061630, partial [Acytostelium subglobosum LB1]|uniref:hypothetical protein n=1 Tax=Acytostelium subglobosum LB1 TaxID=1410327 RepID=UPI000644B357